MADYQTRDFDYELPSELIARYPLPDRTASRMLWVDKAHQSLHDQEFRSLLDHLRPEDLLVFNDTKVIPARLYGFKASGGQLECLVERILGPHRVLAHLRASKAPKPGSLIHLNSLEVRVIGRQNDLFELEFLASKPVLELLQEFGEIPLPHYMDRQPDDLDQQRYQTVFARREGAVAAPTAALHFDQEFLEAVKTKGIEIAYLTLHVGSGTFQPVRTESLAEHVMHTEVMDLSAETCEAIQRCKARGGRVIAVGTTVVRTLESAALKGELEPYQGETNIFIYPGFEFKVVDALVTNFHLPKSTLMMLVCAFGGYELMMKAYQHAVAEKYRFFSYGDSMLIMGSGLSIV